VLGGCKTPEPIVVNTPPETLVPVTRAIIERIGLDEENINGFQLFISGRILLEREDTRPNDSLDGGKLQFEDVHIKEQIIVRDQTPGIPIAIASDNRRTSLAVCFEENEDLILFFTKTNSGPDGYFYLEYTKENTKYGDEKGSLLYGDQTYKIKYSGEYPPYLLVKLDKRDTDRPVTRTALGRLVSTNESDGFDTDTVPDKTESNKSSTPLPPPPR
jgi:hypothetical protein